MADLKVRWRGVVYAIATCMNEERAAVASAEWPDGIVDIATMFAPEHVSDFSEHQRRQLAHMVLGSLGEPTLMLRAPTVESLKGVAKAIPAGFGTIGKAVVSRPAERRKLDHAYVQELAASSSKPKGIRPGAAIRVLEEARTESTIDGAGGDASSSSSSSSGGEGGDAGASSAGNDPPLGGFGGVS